MKSDCGVCASKTEPMEYLRTTFYLKELYSVRWQICLRMIDWNGCERKRPSPLFIHYVSSRQIWLLKTKKTLSGNSRSSSRYSKSESLRCNIRWMYSAIYLPHNHIPARHFVISLRVDALILAMRVVIWQQDVWCVCWVIDNNISGKF